MGFKLISHMLLSRQQMDQAVQEAQRDQERYPHLDIFPPPEDNGGPRGNMPYYVQLINRHPFQYLVFSVDEVMAVLRNHGCFNGTHAALCNILQHNYVPYADNDDDDVEQDDDDDG